MCFSGLQSKKANVCNTFNSDGGISEEPINNELPEHVDNIYLNRNVKTGVLGFRYETKNSTIIVYSSIETKTFCYIMKITPLMKN